jgi:hypothetical protein
VIATETPGAANARGLKGVVTAKRRRPSNQIAHKSPTGPAKGRSPLPRPEPDPEAALVSIGGWRILNLDGTQKRAAARCLNCGTIREISIEALRGGGVSCGCVRARTPSAETFAKSVVAASRHPGR